MTEQIKLNLRDFIDTTVESILVGPQAHAETPTQVQLSLEDLESRKVFRNKFPESGPFAVQFPGEAGSHEAFFSGPRDGDVPMERYGVGVLWASSENGAGEDSPSEEVAETSFTSNDLLGVPVEQAAEGSSSSGESHEEAEVARISRAGTSSLGLSFAVFTHTKELTFTLKGAQYRAFSVPTSENEDQPATLWVRFPFIESRNVLVASEYNVHREEVSVSGLVLELGVIFRQPSNERMTVTAFLVNRTGQNAFASLSEKIVFQASLSVEAKDSNSNVLTFAPVVNANFEHMTNEDLSMAMLYRNMHAFAVGHGIGVQGNLAEPTQLSTTAIPNAEIPAVDAGFESTRMPLLKASDLLMGNFLDPSGFRSWIGSLERLANSYEQWLLQAESAVPDMQIEFSEMAQQNVRGGRSALNRFRRGVALLSEDPSIRNSFCLANESMLDAGPANSRQSLSQRAWRPFQLFFIVMNLEGIAIPESEDRAVADVIWLPTGGGKTEAYLGLASFSIWYKRDTKSDVGTTVLMRYTLRLLTTQQLERAARLIIAMDAIRALRFPSQVPINIGIWIGSGQTPNRQAEAREAYRNMLDGIPAGVGFGVVSCPRCGAPIGRQDSSRTKVAQVPGVRHGAGGRIELFCPKSCTSETAKRLPILFVDDDIYESPPEFLLGTVDKIAILAWNERPRSIFGIGPDGTRVSSGPTLVIQDELHMIAGSLGTAVSMYEPLIDLLTTHGTSAQNVPKVVCSSATIRDFQRQVLQLFGREHSVAFPPPGIHYSETFFTSNRDSAGEENPGTRYRGVYAPALRSNQTAAVRVYSAFLCAMHVAHAAGFDVDPYATLVAFYNSLKDLGYAKTLITSDIPAHLHVMSRQGWISARDAVREIRELELTSRIEGVEIPRIIHRLEEHISAESAVDICLASSMIEVGLDVERLGTMIILGQPKSRSTYIQVSGRVGRQWRKTPGLVYVVFSLGKARDLTHYEHFIDVHQRLYAEVTPTLLAPFIAPALARYLPAVLTAYIRQTSEARFVESGASLSPENYDVAPWVNRYLERASRHGQSELMGAHVEKLLNQLRRRAGRRWLREQSTPRSTLGPHPAIDDASTPDAPQYQDSIWLVPRSLRAIEPLSRLGTREHFI